MSATKPGKPSKPKPQRNSPSGEKPDEGSGVGFDALLGRLLAMPPTPRVAKAPRPAKKATRKAV